MNSTQELSAHPETPSSSKQAKNDFPKSNRLLSPKSYSHVFAQAERFGNRNWTMIVRPNNEDYPRLGLAIAKKQLQRAVWRNRVKRIAREAFRSHKKELSGYDIVVLGRKGMQDLDNETLHSSFLHLVRKIKKSKLKNSPSK
ncbi:ribonuclease P protein component [Thiomicrorhabdus lithotrophica]|uniref:Ribonuclease P protein component n=1 Tax=Thiomicrorhabdus lithotrophica TaxID=2949997 RepID=A0ABY8C9M5_9GAMM|nr:ribonuclease P protein component [Thiomicrorhabdus lithotrophica]WEJ62654.1 ribonuclease P protein component [Thiomicrorhabdus lithotrophica]